MTSRRRASKTKNPPAEGQLSFDFNTAGQSRALAIVADPVPITRAPVPQALVGDFDNGYRRTEGGIELLLRQLSEKYEDRAWRLAYAVITCAILAIFIKGGIPVSQAVL